MYKAIIHPINIEILSNKDSVLLDVLLLNGINIPNYCGGSGACKKCAVKLLDGKLSEDSKFGDYYLACKARIESDVVIELFNFDEQLKDNSSFSDFEFEAIYPLVEEMFVQVAPPDVNNKLSDLERMRASLNCDYFIRSVNFVQKLPTYLRENNRLLFLVIDKNKKEIIDLNKETSPIYGIAVDIGTTTVNMILVDLKTGKIVDNESSYNKQISCGADVISRIVYSEKNNGLQNLHNLIIENLNELIGIIVARNNINRSNIYSVVIGGNTTMIHLLANITPKYIRQEPYIPAFSNLDILARDIGLCVNNNAEIHCFPSVGSFVGGDIVSGILSSGMYKQNKISLFIDIGTNGEIVLGNDEWLMSCACSAGPALEGAGVKCGTRAVSGAIEKFKINPDNLEPLYETINSSLPVGICGSGMIDIIAELFDKGLIDRQGKFFKGKSNRIVFDNNRVSYLIADEKASGNNKPIIITEQDIENIIRTKGAIFAGINSLLNYAGIGFDDIDEVLIAGGLGKSINFNNAIKIGLLPDLSREKYKYLGNTSLKGAYMLLVNSENFEFIDKITSMMNYFDISEDVGYMDFFISSLFLPHTNLSLFPSF